MMRGLALLFAMLLIGLGAAADDGARFDGSWDTTLSCKNTDGALGYSFEFTSTVKSGMLRGEKGEEGKPGWLLIGGNIQEDGTAKLYAKGLVGAKEYAVGRRPAGSGYGYHIEAKFSEKEGSGKRVEGRPCEVEFKKQ